MRKRMKYALRPTLSNSSGQIDAKYFYYIENESPNVINRLPASFICIYLPLWYEPLKPDACRSGA
jgi:hypothetical protein